MDVTLMEQGFQLLCYGMGVVFVFLSLLVLCVSVMSSLINRFFLEPVESEKPPQVVSSGTECISDPHLVKVIAAAVELHRKSQRQ